MNSENRALDDKINRITCEVESILYFNTTFYKNFPIYTYTLNRRAYSMYLYHLFGYQIILFLIIEVVRCDPMSGENHNYLGGTWTGEKVD